LKYLIVDSFVVESIINVVDGELVDENKTHLLASIGIFCLFVEIVFNEKECKKNISKPMPHFGNNTFSKSNKRYNALPKSISENQY
jgi:hypothetical protein